MGKIKSGISLQDFVERAEKDLGGMLGEAVVRARLAEAPYSPMSRFMALGVLALDTLKGRPGAAASFTAPRISVLPAPLATLPAIATAPPPATVDLNKLRRLAVEVLGSASISQSDTLEEIQKRFHVEGLTLPGMPASTREMFGSQRYVRAARQATIDAFFNSGKSEPKGNL